MKFNFKKCSLISLAILSISLSGCANNSSTLKPTEETQESVIEAPNDTLFASTSSFSTINCAILWPACDATDNSKNKVYIFKGDQYIRYDFVSTYADPGYPKKIGDVWGGMGDFASGFDAGFVNPTTMKAYFFKDDQYLRRDVKAGQTDSGYPRKISASWPGVASLGKLDTAFLRPGTNDVYFFKGDQYLKYNLATSKPYDGYPKKISDKWGGMTGNFGSNLNAAVTSPTDPNKVYFFKGTEYVRYDLSTSKVDPGYPQAISNNWHINTVKPNPTSNWVKPLKSIRVTQQFNNYYEPKNGYHLGIDYGNNGDRNVLATFKGTVVTAKYVGANGNCVIIKHTTDGKTVYSGYSHLESISVKANATVNAGDKIGVMGTTGKDKNGNPTSTGIHLHFFITDTLFNDAYGYSYPGTRSTNKIVYNGATFYNPDYVVNNNGKLP